MPPEPCPHHEAVVLELAHHKQSNDELRDDLRENTKAINALVDEMRGTAEHIGMRGAMSKMDDRLSAVEKAQDAAKPVLGPIVWLTSGKRWRIVAGLMALLTLGASGTFGIESVAKYVWEYLTK